MIRNVDFRTIFFQSNENIRIKVIAGYKKLSEFYYNDAYRKARVRAENGDKYAFADEFNFAEIF
jgi:hypothetical protein